MIKTPTSVGRSTGAAELTPPTGSTTPRVGLAVSGSEAERGSRSELGRAHSAEASPREPGRRVMLADLRSAVGGQGGVAAQAANAKLGATALILERDDGASGLRMAKRPGLQRALDQVRSGAVDVLWVSDVARASRNAVDMDALARASATVEDGCGRT